jgi:hypothetical protein
MATDIGSLAAGLDRRVVRLGIERKKLRKTWGTPHTFLGATPFQCSFSWSKLLIKVC